MTGRFMPGWRRLTSSISFKLLVILISYLLFTMILAAGATLVAGLREGILNSDQYFNSLSYRRQVESMMSGLIRRGPTAWDDTDLPGNLRYAIGQGDRLVATNLSSATALKTLAEAAARLKAISASDDLVSSSDYYLPSAIALTSIRYEYVATVDKTLAADDVFAIAARAYLAIKPYMRLSLRLVIPALLLFLICLSYLIRTTGRSSPDGPVKRAFYDVIPGDLLTAVCLVIIWLIGRMGWIYGFIWIYDSNFDVIYSLLLFALYCLPMYLIGLLLLLSLARRAHLGTIWSDTLAVRVSHLVAQDLPAALSMVLRFIGFLIVDIILIVLLGTYPASWLVFLAFNTVMLVYLVSWAASFARISKATQDIAEGTLETQIDSQAISRPLRRHAETINSIGGGLGVEVSRRVRSERLRAELIANVSHDIRTPLTAIISYIDLLRKNPLDESRAQQYLEILDRHAKRLEVLTSDLVDLSKFATGNVQLKLETLDLAELIRQGLGEFSERLNEVGLVRAVDIPDHPVWVRADGKYFWRILENLLSNLTKYAQTGSRIYIELVARGRPDHGGEAIWTQKNISATPLNITPEELTERFVRGDASRRDGSSGLGLAIARSLVELQGGRLELAIDGDLFKSTIILPLTGPPA